MRILIILLFAVPSLAEFDLTRDALVHRDGRLESAFLRNIQERGVQNVFRDMELSMARSMDIAMSSETPREIRQIERNRIHRLGRAFFYMRITRDTSGRPLLNTELSERAQIIHRNYGAGLSTINSYHTLRLSMASSPDLSARLSDVRSQAFTRVFGASRSRILMGLIAGSALVGSTTAQAQEPHESEAEIIFQDVQVTQ
jgi:hypothetical protein